MATTGGCGSVSGRSSASPTGSCGDQVDRPTDGASACCSGSLRSVRGEGFIVRCNPNREPNISFTKCVATISALVVREVVEPHDTSSGHGVRESSGASRTARPCSLISSRVERSCRSRKPRRPASIRSWANVAAVPARAGESIAKAGALVDPRTPLNVQICRSAFSSQPADVMVAVSLHSSSASVLPTSRRGTRR
jgi:hypothetical protein